jgi:AhpD family alkylhydroperoxidase
MIYRDCQEALTLRLFRDLPEHALATKALDGETKELIALGISVAIRCDDCIAFHAKAALKQGANREEVMEALGMACHFASLSLTSNRG